MIEAGNRIYSALQFSCRLSIWNGGFSFDIWLIEPGRPICPLVVLILMD